MTLLDTALVGEPQLPQSASAPSTDILVLAVGNLLMGDEGVGIHVLRELELLPPLRGVRLLDGGTGGVYLLEDIQTAPVVVMIDATRDGKPAGTVTLLRPQTARSLPQGLSAHDFGLKDLFAAATLLRAMPDVRLFTISVEAIHPMCLTLTPEVAAAIPAVVSGIRRLLTELTEGKEKR